MTSRQVECMIEWEETQTCDITTLTEWDCLEIDRDIRNDFSYYRLISLAENTLGKSVFTEETVDEKLIDLSSDVFHSALQECLRTKSKEHLNTITVLNHLCYKVMNVKQGKSTDFSSVYIDKSYGSSILCSILGWIMGFGINWDINKDFENKIRLDVVSMSRKEGNLIMCNRELNRFFAKSKYEFTVDNLTAKLTDDLILKDTEIFDELTSAGLYETSKLLYVTQNRKEDAIQLAVSTTIGIKNRLKIIESPKLNERSSRILLTLSEWIQQEPEITGTPLINFLNNLDEITPNSDETVPSIIPSIDSAVGKLIQNSVKQCPELAKAWGALGAWCYRWGRKMVEIRNDDKNKAGLHLNDVSAIKNLIPNATTVDIDKIVSILNQHQVTDGDEDIGPNETNSTEIIEAQLRTVRILAGISQEHLFLIMEIWRQAHKTVYGYYEKSADSYFRYLQLATSSTINQDDESGDCSVVTATLRLLRLVVKHAMGLQEVLEEGLATTPTSPWKIIIPQLFSRMNHHEPYVRRCVSELLCRVAKDSPHLIIFPTVVGAAQGQRTDLADISMASEDFDEETNLMEMDSSGLTNCFNSLLDTLSKEASETVSQVQLLVRELKRITLLWDELWLVTLVQIYSEWAKRFIAFESEVQKYKNTTEKSVILAGKHNIMIKPVIFVMEKLYEMTSRKPETNHERNFQEKYQKIIEDTINVLRQSFDPEKPYEAWHKFKGLYGLLQQRAQKRSFFTLKMTDISPALAQLKNTVISMPGAESSGLEPVLIKSVDNIIHILPTKTKPKKLAFHGSDGKKYTYLFKGLEDLHLDERIMQFLQIANSMMTKSTDSNGNISKYRARHYSVIPLGPRSGLISWVDGVVPIFALYKKWQQREAANPRKDKQVGVVMRPSEMYYR